MSESLMSPILVFDSGVGGLSVLAEIERLFPGRNYLFCIDNAGFPYGTKTETDVTARVRQVLTELIPKYSPSLVVIACNTASTVALEEVRVEHSIPIVGVVPAIKPAAATSKTKIIGLLATPGTVMRPYTDKLIREFAPDCRVVKVGSEPLVEMAEARLRGTEPALAAIKKETAPLAAVKDLDTVVLGCTHFPLLKDLLQKALPQVSQWLDSGAAIAKRVAEISSTNESGEGRKIALFTRNDESSKMLLPYLQKNRFSIA